MDYRHRKYYLIRVFRNTTDLRLNCFKEAAPSIKILSAYNHFPYHEKDKWGRERYSYDGTFFEKTGVNMPGMVISCKIEESDSLEKELKRMVELDGAYSQYCELTKSLCTQ